jgi:hypothetical protein
MRQSWRAWTAAGLAIVLVGAVPVVLDRDSFPLSTFPMFAADIDRTQSVDTAVGLAADGTTIRLTPEDIAGTTVVNQAATVVTTAIVGGRADELCAAIAGRLAVQTGPVAVEVVTERYDAVRWFDGDRIPEDRTVHAHCAVAP